MSVYECVCVNVLECVSVCVHECVCVLCVSVCVVARCREAEMMNRHREF